MKVNIENKRVEKETQKTSRKMTNKNIVNKLINKILEEDTSIELAEFFKVFGDSTRIRIISVLSKSEACVGDIATLLNMSQSSISHQLKILRDAKLVKYRKEGKTVNYYLADNHVEDIYEEGLEHIKE
jgi:ArsR family transcriptional regulator